MFDLEKIEKWRVALAKEILSNKKENINPTEFAKEFAAIHSLDWEKVRVTYYNYIKKIPNSIMAEIQGRKAIIGTPYYEGDIVEVRVKALLDKGVIVELTDGSEFGGWIHISRIAHCFISEISEFFNMNDIVLAEVVGIQEGGNRLTLSTLNTIDMKRESNESHVSPLITPPEELPSKVNTLFSLTDAELDDLTYYIRKLIGENPSASAMRKFGEIFKAHGTIKATLAMQKVGEGFKVDFGLLLAEQVEKALKASNF